MRKAITTLLLVAGSCLVIWGPHQACSGQGSKDWVARKDAGFSVEVPRGWTVRVEPKWGRLEIQGTAREQLIVWPVFVPGPLNTAAAPSVLAKLAAGLWPDARWEAAQPVSTVAIRARGRAGDRLALCALTWVASPKGSAGYLYAVAAPEAGYRLLEDTLARVLQSVRVTGDPSGAQQPSLNYVRWQDPRENAFSVEVPTGWKMSGGLFRFASVDTRLAWELLSPDGQIRITGGDAELPTFSLPSQTLAIAGFHEGSWYSPGYGLNMLVQRYLPGVAFARWYVTQKATRNCAELTFTETRERPDAVQAINAIHRQSGSYVSTSLTAGEVAFTCRQGDQPAKGYYFAGTQLTQSPGSGIWNVEYLCGFVAPSDKAALAQSVLNHVVQSGQTNPQWAATQQNIAANTSRIVSRTQEEVSRIINDTYWNRQGTMDELSRRRSNATLGVEDVIDSATGREIKVESGSNHYWIDHRGTIVGTETDTRPNLDFRQLIRLP